MNWKNSVRDELPGDSERVLICVDGVYYIAVFDGSKGLFRVEDELLETVFRINQHHIYWTTIKSET